MLDIYQDRNLFLESGGVFSVKQLEQFGLSREVVGGYREMLYVSQHSPVRLVPLNLLNAIKLQLENQNIESVVDSFYSAFVIYRNSVNNGLSPAPLVKADDNVFEWPEPEDISWGDLDSVQILGIKMDKLRKNPYRESKFKIPKLNNVGMVNANKWQNVSLHFFASDLMALVEDLRTDKVSIIVAKYFLESKIEELEDPMEMLIARYSLTGEKTSINALYQDFT